MENPVDILQLINSDGIGTITFYKYLKKFGTAENALKNLNPKKRTYSKSQAEDEIAKAKKMNIKIIPFDSFDYPQTLLNIPDAPPILYVLGNEKLLNHRPNIAIVGARNASINGRKIASRIAYDLTQNDVLTVSGMARGIDTSAHKGAMYAKNQHGPTIAVLGTGVDVIYPSENTEIYESIAQNGAILSEFPIGTPAQSSNFPRRNRIISGICEGTLVVEATIKSGSLITAGTALEQGKDVFAVPGSPLDPRSAGPNQLIRDGAILTETADDILNFLAMNVNFQTQKRQFEIFALDNKENNVDIPKPEKPAKKATLKSNSKAECSDIFTLIDYQGIDIDELLRTSGLEQGEFFAQLMNLEFEGKIVRQTGNRVAKIK